MHTEMWEHPAVQDNLRVLASRGVVVVEPEAGRLAGGDLGMGRLADPETIVTAVEHTLGRKDLDGWRVLVTAGGTREAIDPVRVISNRSSGKQGYALAEEAASRGAKVTLVTTVDRPAPADIDVVPVTSAADMEAAVMPRSGDQDVVIMAAAVADFRPAQPAEHKIKKGDRPEHLTLEPTHDFLVDLGERKPAGQVLVGFAAETDDLVENALEKLVSKHLDLIVANDVGQPGAGFEHDTNQVKILSAAGIEHDGGLTDKRAVARAVLDAVVAARRGTPPDPQNRSNT
jgi:phosphopantothenoylcysteine decarboxylase / phosphopantothenate---cysteine ligase